MKDARLSIASRSESWNTFCVSTTPYPATIMPASTDIMQILRGELGRLFPCDPWIRRDMICHIGMLLQLRGSPRDPGLVADTNSIMMYAKGGLAGPTGGHPHLDRDIQTMKAWDQAVVSDPPITPFPSRRQIQAVRTLLRAHYDLPHFGRGRGVARAIYTALWTIRRRTIAQEYVTQRSQQRRWRPSNGREWIPMQRFPHWAKAWVTARLYCNGLPGSARTRPRTQNTPTTCWGYCQETDLRWRWLSGCQSTTGGATDYRLVRSLHAAVHERSSGLPRTTL